MAAERPPSARPESPVPFRPVPSARRVTRQLIEPLLNRPERIRNVCILAHVDHGKTTLTDSLLASNGIISFKQAGTLRYMDAREDEQERGITMESSAVSLLFDLRPEIASILSRSPSTSSLSGTNSVTEDAISSRLEGLSIGDRRFLVNLIDSPGHVDFSSQVMTAAKLCDGCLVLVDAVEGVCTQTAAVLRQAFKDRLTPCLVINKMDRLVTELKLSSTEAAEWLFRLLAQVNAIQATISASANFEPLGDEEVNDTEEITRVFTPTPCNSGDEVFSPSKGNVIFASATDGWAFRIDQFARLFAKKLEMKEDVLQQTLWGEYYMDAKNKRVVLKKAAEKLGLGKPMFAQFILDNIWPVYEVTSKDGWDQTRLEKIAGNLNVKLPLRELKARDGRTVLRTIMTTWLPLADAAFVAIVEQLPNPIEACRSRIPHLLGLCTGANELEWPLEACQLIEDISGPGAGSVNSPAVGYLSKMFAVQMGPDSGNADDNEEHQRSQEKLIGMVRLFHGSIRVGQNIKVLRPKYHPSRPNEAFADVTVESLYLLMGRDLEPVDTVYAGNVFGIGGLEAFVGKSATLSDSSSCPSFDALSCNKSVPIVRVAVQPTNLSQMAELEAGLKLLCQADPCAESYLQVENGEHILAAAGELHLEQCLKDLRERFTHIDGIEVSPPMVPFRETIVADKAISEALWKDGLDEEKGEGVDDEGTITMTVPNGLLSVSIRAFPLSTELVDFVSSHRRTIRAIGFDSPSPNYEDPLVRDLVGLLPFDKENILAFGPRHCGPNVLISSSASKEQLGGEYREFLTSILAGYQLASDQGPLCGEPMMGVGFVLENIQKQAYPQQDDPEFCNLTSAAKGQLISTVKDCLHRAFMYHSPRLMLAMYSCDIQTTAEVLGRVYAVVARRMGTIQAEEYNEGTGFFTVKSLIPVIESFGFADDIRGRTSGLAIPQLLFHGFRVFEQDPFWVPTTEAELEDFGEIAEKANVALRYLIKVRERKGLFVEKKIVQFAEKQRNMKK